MNTLQLIFAFLKRNWAGFVGLFMVVWTYAAPTVHNFITNHPKYSFWFGLASVIVAYYLPSPLRWQQRTLAPPKPSAPPNVR